MKLSSPFKAGLILIGLLVFSTGIGFAQQYRNLEVVPDGRGGAYGSYGGKNFQVEKDYSKPPARHYTNGTQRPSATPDRNASLPRGCLLNNEGRPVCP